MTSIILESSLHAGPVDLKEVSRISKIYPLDSDYLNFLEKYHGCEVSNCYIKVSDKKYNLELFLTILDEDSELIGEFRPHFDQADIDFRIVNSISNLMDCESNTSAALFQDLVPFAATQKEMCLDRGYVDLFCFDYRKHKSNPSIIIWNAEQAMNAYFEWNSLSFEEKFDGDDNFINVNWNSFVVPISESFLNFISLLKTEPK